MPVKEVMPVEVRSVGITSVVNPMEAAITAMKDGRGVIAAAVKGNTAAVGDCSAAMKTAASVETSTTMEAAPTAVETATAAMPHLGRQTAGC